MKTMSIIRGLAVIAVVLGHAIYWVDLGQAQLTGMPGVGSFCFDSQLQTPTYHILKIIYLLTLFDVPVFLFASGLFIAYANIGGKGLRWQSIGKWIKLLAIPFVCWVTVHTLVSWLPIIVFPQEGARGVLLRFLGALNLAYFVPLVVQFYLLAPYIARLAQKHWIKLLVGSAILQVTISIIWYLPRIGVPVSPSVERFSEVSIFFFWGWAIYFPLGVVCGTKLSQLKPWLYKNRLWLAILLAISAILAVIEMETLGRFGDFIDPNHHSITVILYSIALILFLMAIGDRWLASQRQLIDIGLKSLGIYLAHPIVFLTVFRVVKYTYPKLVFYPWLYLPLLFITGFGLPLWLGSILAKSSKKVYYHYLYG